LYFTYRDILEINAYTLVTTNFRRLSIRWQLAFLGMVTVVPLVALTLFGIWGDLRDQRHDALNECLDDVQEASRILGRFFDNSQQRVVDFAQSAKVSDASGKPERIQTFGLLQPFYGNVGITDSTGRVLASEIPLKTSISLAYLPEFQKVRRTRRIVLGNASLGPISHRYVSGLFCPVRNDEHPNSRFAFLTIDLSALNQLVSTERWSSRARLTIVDASEQIVYDSELALPSGEPVTTKGTDFGPLTDLPGEGTTELTSLDGAKRLYAYSTVEPWGWKVYISRRSSFVNDRVWGDWKSRLLFPVIIILLVCFGALYVIRELESPNTPVPSHRSTSPGRLE